jgi:hypothetical protein
LIIGGESGPGARPFDLAWARATVAQCRAAGVPVFCKQLGARPFDSEYAPTLTPAGIQTVREITLRDRKGADPSEWPAELRVRAFPR